MLDDRLEAALLEVAVARRALADLEAALVVQARAVGATWTEIAAPLSLTKQGVRKRHLAVDPIYARRTQRPPTLDEYYAEMYAALGPAPG
jgi:hypothetical protein